MLAFVYCGSRCDQICVIGFYFGDVLFFIQLVVFGQLGYLRVAPELMVEMYAVGALFAIMGIWRHKANIKRLLSGTENKFSFKKSGNLEKK